MVSKQRYVLLGILCLAAVVGLALSHGLAWTWSQANLSNPALLGSADLPLTSLLGYGTALLGALGIWRNSTAHTWAGEVVDELTRVAWPSQQETRHATMVVIVAVVVCAGYLGIFDAFWLTMTDFILDVPKADALS